MLESGTEIAGYRVEAVLGRGGMGTVYEAVQPFVLRRVALKLLEPALAADPDFRARFRREAEMQARIEHAHIVTVHEAGEAQQGLFIAMQLVRGPNLKELIRGGDLEPHRAVAILGQVADALDTAHATGLIHRDVKPQNVLVGPGDHAFLADFGVTKAASDTGFTRTGQFLGTLDYVSPEQLDGRPASAASDLYALAAVAYECLVGTVPFPKPTEAGVLFAHLSEDPPSASAQCPNLPAAVDDAIRHGMAKRPDARPPSARAFILELASALGEAPRVSKPPPAQAPPPVAAPPLRPVEPPDDGSTEVIDDRLGAPTRSDLRRKESLPTAPRPRAATAETETAPAPPAEPEPRAEPEPEPEPPSEPEAEREPEPEPTSEPEAERAPEPGPPPPPKPAPATRPVKPARERPRAETIRRRRRVAVAGVIAALAVGGAIAGAATSGGEKAPAAPAAVKAGDLSIAAPAGFRPATAAAAGVNLENAAAAGDAGGRGLIAAGRTDASGPLLLPKDLVATLSPQPRAGEPVRLGTVGALRFRDLRTRDGGRITVYAAPTAQGVATIVCRGVAQADCDRAAASLRLAPGVRATGVGPDSGYASAVSAALRRVAKASESAGGTLRQARSPRTQASSAAALQRAYATAAQALRRVDPGPRETPAHAELVAATAAGASAWRDVARAARAGDDAAFARARRAVRTASDRMARARSALEELGYRTA